MKHLNKVLIVDDDMVSRFLIERTIKKVGISQNILSATNGEEALDIIKDSCSKAECPELILLDISMPVMDGFEFLDELQSSSLAELTTKIILLSSSINPEDVAKATKHSLAGYLAKPLTEDNLKALYA